MSPKAAEATPPPGLRRCYVSRLAVNIRRGGSRRLYGLLASPFADHYFFIHQWHKYGRAQRGPAPIHDSPVEILDGITYLLLRVQVLHIFGQPFDFLTQLQRRRQELLCRHALSAQVVPQPGLAVIRFAPVRDRLTRAGQIIEYTSFLRLNDLLVYPRGEAHPWRLTLCHPDALSSGDRLQLWLLPRSSASNSRSRPWIP